MVEVVVLSRLPPQRVKNLLCNSDFSNQTLEKERRISDSCREGTK